MVVQGSARERVIAREQERFHRFPIAGEEIVPQFARRCIEAAERDKGNRAV